LKPKTILFGPFVGELCWEFFRFAPYAIHLKKTNPNLKLIVLTRPSRFDLYGRYANILVPLRLREKSNFDGFGMTKYLDENYYDLVVYFRKKFKKRFRLIYHHYPDVRSWRRKVKWQFPRDQMDYDFRPRKENTQLAKKVMFKKMGIVESSATEKSIKRDDIIDTVDLMCLITNFTTDNPTSLGTLIECIKLAKFVVGDIQHDISHLSLLLKTPLIHVEKPISKDYIKLMNPLETPVIISENIKQGVKIYENNF